MLCHVLSCSHTGLKDEKQIKKSFYLFMSGCIHFMSVSTPCPVMSVPSDGEY